MYVISCRIGWAIKILYIYIYIYIRTVAKVFSFMIKIVIHNSCETAITTLIYECETSIVEYGRSLLKMDKVWYCTNVLYDMKLRKVS